jgi:DNA polymerase III epsilon subunit-like protein
MTRNGTERRWPMSDGPRRDQQSSEGAPKTTADHAAGGPGPKLLNTETLSAGTMELAYVYLIFDPGRKSHPSAEAIHGYSDWALRHQESVDVYADTIESFFDSADLVVAHNAEFYIGFYNREMERLGRPPNYQTDFLHHERLSPERPCRQRIFECRLPESWRCAGRESSWCT